MAEILVLAEHDGETVKKVTCELLTLARDFGEPAVVWTGEGAEAAQARLRIRQLSDALAQHVQSTITSLQFYDKLIQRLTHVRDGLAIPSDSTFDRGDQAGSDWTAMLEQVRSKYSMVEERVLFDFMMRGLSADQMLKALTGLRGTATPGELEVF